MLLGFSALLYPYAIAGFFFDDIYNSLLSGTTQYGDSSLAEFIEKQLYQWFGVGRFFPVAIITISYIWDFCDSLIKYRVIHLAFIALNALLFFKFVLKISGSNRIAGLTILFLPMFFQFNPRWDGVTSFGPLNQLTFSLVLISWLSLIKYLNTRQQRFLWCSLIAEFLAFSTYEVSVVVLPVQILLIFMYESKSKELRKRALIGCSIVGLVYLAICAYLIVNRISAYDGINPSFTPSPPTFFYQFTSALPLSFIANKILPMNFNFALFLGLSTIYFLISTKFWKITSIQGGSNTNTFAGHKNLLILTALLLAVIPPVLMALSSRYQTIVSYGDPYIVVYIQYWGCALFFAIIFEISFRKVKSINKNLISIFLLISIIVALTISVNASRIKDQNSNFLKPRLDMQRAIESGFMRQLNSGDLLVVDSNLPWEVDDSCAAYFSMSLKKRIGCISILGLSNEGIFRDKVLGAKARLNNVFTYSKVQTSKSSNAFRLGGDSGVWIADHDGVGNPMDVKFYPGLQGLIVGPILGVEFYGWEPSGKREWSWSKGDSSIIFYNLQSSNVKKDFSFSIQSAINQNFNVYLNGKHLTMKEVKPGLPQELGLKLDLYPGKNIVELKASGKPIRLSAADDRLFSFRISNIDNN